MTWTKYNNPSKKRKPRRKLDRTDADILAGKQMLEDKANGIEMPLKYYDEISDRLCSKPSRGIYTESPKEEAKEDDKENKS